MFHVERRRIVDFSLERSTWNMSTHNGAIYWCSTWNNGGVQALGPIPRGTTSDQERIRRHESVDPSLVSNCFTWNVPANRPLASSPGTDFIASRVPGRESAPRGTPERCDLQEYRSDQKNTPTHPGKALGTPAVRFDKESRKSL